MKKSVGRGKVGVEAVRQRGGDCLEAVRQRVRVVREDERVETGEEIEELNMRDQQERQRLQELRQVAQIRGEGAQRKVAQDRWLEEALLREEAERKEAVRLMEMLRTARLLSEAPPAKTADICPGPVPSTALKPASHSSSSNSIISTTSTVTSSATMTDSAVKISRVKPSVTFAEPQKQLIRSKSGPSLPDYKERQFVKLSSGIRPLDDTEEVSQLSGLSTILEESERLTTTSLTSRSLPDLELETQQVMEGEPTTFPLSSITTNRDRGTQQSAPAENINLSEVRKIIERVKQQGERLPLTETHFQTIAGNGNGSTTKVDSGVGQEKEKYEVNQDFIKKVLDFSSTSPLSTLSSDESSSFFSLQKSLPKSKKSKPKSVPATKLEKLKKPTFSPILKPQTVSQISDDSTRRLSPEPKSLPSADSKSKEKPEFQAELRRYIVKLLQMRKEDIENLSVSSTVEDKSVSTEQDLKIDCDKILELYQSTRSNLQSKLSKSELPGKK